MNTSISSSSSHMINSINSSVVCNFNLEFVDPQVSPRNLNQPDSNNSSHSISSNSFPQKSIRIDSHENSFQSIQKASSIRSLAKDKKKPRKNFTIPPPRIIELSECSKRSEQNADNYQLIKNTVRYFECFEFKRGCMERVLCKKLTILEKIKQLKEGKIENKYCKRSFKKVMRTRNDIKMVFDRRVNIVDLNVLMILLKDSSKEFDSFLNRFGVQVLYFQIYEVTNKVLTGLKKISKNSKIFTETHPLEYLIRAIAGYFLIILN